MLLGVVGQAVAVNVLLVIAEVAAALVHPAQRGGRRVHVAAKAPALEAENVARVANGPVAIHVVSTLIARALGRRVGVAGGRGAGGIADGVTGRRGVRRLIAVAVGHDHHAGVWVGV